MEGNSWIPGSVAPAFSTPNKPEPDVYYGLFLPDFTEVSDEQDVQKVYTDKIACLSVMKKHRGSRFKSFNTFEDAATFSENGPIVTVAHTEESKCSNLNVEKPSPYRGPKSQDLVKFRKAIEKDDIEYFNQCMEENPRYLVSSGDTPSILQEGSRYNALHISCRADRPHYLSKVLLMVADAQFFQKLYPDDSLESSERRSRYLLDAYLNTPDKGLNETPLHFASKHGSLECVRILTSYTDCCRKRKNKFSQTPIEIVGSRAKNISKDVMSEICELLGEHCYVPLLRDDDLYILPQVGEPWSPKQDSPGCITAEQQLLSFLSPGSSGSPHSPITPTLKVRGYAGPMSPSQAECFYRRWREVGVLSPTRSAKARPVSLRLTDQEKGLERVGRELAVSNGHCWSEYWDFLGQFANIASNDGLNKLEKHLKRKCKEVTDQQELDASLLREKLCDTTHQESSETPNVQNESKDQSSSINLNESDLSRASQSTMGELCQELEALRLNASLSPQLNASGQPLISASSKFLQLWKDREKIQDGKDQVANKVTHPEPDVGHLSYITKSIHVSAFRLAEVLDDLAKELQSYKVTNLSVGKVMRMKLKPEILCLKNVVSKCFMDEVSSDVDCGYIHILLAFKATELVQQNLVPSDVCVLAETLRVVVSNLNFVNANSSDEEEYDSGNEPKSCQEKRENAKHISCVLKALEKALSIAYNNSNPEVSLNDNSNSIRTHLMHLGDCTCSWYSKSEEKIMVKDKDNCTPVSSQKYNKAFNFLHQTLFSESKSREVNQNDKNYRGQKETIVKQLSFEEEGKNVIKATLTIGTGKLGRVESVEENTEEEENDDADSFETAPSSVEDDNMMTPEEGLKVYINGDEASKIDADVLTAIEVTEVDDRLYPHVAQWLHLVKSHSEVERNSWMTPYSARNYPSVTPRMSGSSISTPPRQHRSFIPSSVPRILFSKQRGEFPSSPS